MVIGKDGDWKSGEPRGSGSRLLPGAQTLDGGSRGIRSGGIRRQPGERKVRSSSVMSFGETTEFGYDRPSEVPAPKPWWEHETASVHSMWPTSRKNKRKHKRNPHKSGGVDAFNTASAGFEDLATDTDAESPESPELSPAKCRADCSARVCDLACVSASSPIASPFSGSRRMPVAHDLCPTPTTVCLSACVLCFTLETERVRVEHSTSVDG